MLRPSRLILPVALLALAACDIPSGVPNWDTTWNVPSQSLTLGVGQVLPAGVTVMADRSAFDVALAPVTVSQRLGDQCVDCVLLAGRTVPKPAFQANIVTSTALPNDVQGGSLAAGARIDVRIANGTTFDPIRPAAGVTGYVTITVRNGATVLASDSVNGSTAALPAGGSLSRTLTLAGGSVSGPITVLVTMQSPAGDPIVVDPARTFSVTATPNALRVTQATVSVRSAQVSQSTTSDLDISSSIADRVQSGRLLVDVKDPFTVQGALSVRLSAPGTNLVKPLTVTGGNKGYSIAFTGDELRTLFGKTITITFAGPLSAGSALTVTPTQSISIGTRFELVLSSSN